MSFQKQLCSWLATFGHVVALFGEHFEIDPACSHVATHALPAANPHDANAHQQLKMLIWLV
eukprot:773888-Amphidinium_carterae.1